MKRMAFIFGTRPEAIKLCPLILEMRKTSSLSPHVCVTGQHRHLLDQVLNVFDIVPDVDLALMENNQTLAKLTSKAILAIDSYLTDIKPDMIIVQGDTTTVFCAAIAAFYRQIPIGHVEAGLRTWNKLSPFPEEINRVLTSKIADIHFAPTEASKNNLLKEGVLPKSIYVTGNTVIDALYCVINRIKKNPPVIPGLGYLFDAENERDVVLITGHRRENHGQGFLDICRAIRVLAEQFQETYFVYPVHLNPNVQRPVYDLLSGIDNIKLVEPLSYMPFVAMMNRAKVILTDSGGVQEEAPSIGKPVLVMRDTTERPEAVEAGTVKLVGADFNSIVNNVSILLTNVTVYEKMAHAINPYGDGKACQRIITVLKSL